MHEINATDVHYKELNEEIRESIRNNEHDLILDGVCGQYYIGCGISNSNVKITINGVPGNDLGAFMNGPVINVMNNAQDGIGNTMNGGKIVIHGSVGDVLAYSMRGGSIFVKENVGYRACIHMKAYKEMNPTVVIGGCAGAFAGEYMAGGTMILLGLNKSETRPIAGVYLATGMHGGSIFIRGKISHDILWEKAEIEAVTNEDYTNIKNNVKEFCNIFKIDYNRVMDEEFVKVVPESSRPYGNLYIPGP